MRRSSKRSFHGFTDRTRLRRLKSALSKGASQQVSRIEDLRHTHVSHKWLHHLDACTCGKDLETGREQDLASAACTAPSWTHSLNTEKPAAPPKPRGDTTRCVHAVVCGSTLADPSSTTEPRGLTASQPRPADILTTAVVSGRRAGVDVCVSPLPMQQQLEETRRRRTV